MKRLSIHTRIILITTAVLALALATNATINELFFEREYTKLLESKLLGAGETLAAQLNHLLALGIALDEIVGFEEQCREIVSRHRLAYALVMEKNGRILFHNAPTPSPSFFRHPTLIKRAAEPRARVELIEVDKEKYYHASIPISAPGGEHLGAIMVGFPARILREKKTHLVASSTGVTILSLLAAIGLLTFIITLSVTRPLKRLIEEIERIKEGDKEDQLILTVPAPTEELGRLAKAFNELLADLYASRRELERHAQELQRMVDERTRELKAANEALEEDIARRKAIEAELARRAEDLARSNAELEHFAYIASHDLKEPLRMITGYLQLLARRYRGKLDADADEFIDYAVDGAKRMEALINGLLAYARVGTSGKLFAPTDADSALDQALANLKTVIAESGATIERGHLPVVHADEVQLVQVFQNLISNAEPFA
ncbi:MAG: histidine kinase dimerization/phospho-acceptor domain-containing protein [Bacillota bacterium]